MNHIINAGLALGVYWWAQTNLPVALGVSLFVILDTADFPAWRH